MKHSRYNEGLRLFYKLVTGRPPKFQSLTQYSLGRMLLIGLAFPAIIVGVLLIAVFAALATALSAATAFMLMGIATMGAFAAAVILMVKISRWAVEFARVKRK